MLIRPLFNVLFGYIKMGLTMEEVGDVIKKLPNYLDLCVDTERNFTAEEVVALVEAVNCNPRVTEFPLSMQGLTDANAKVLATAKYLRKLDLHNNQITDVGARALAANNHLQELNLRDNRVTPRGSVAFLENTSLICLDLDRAIPRKLQDTLSAHLIANQAVLLLTQQCPEYNSGDYCQKKLIIRDGMLRIVGYSLSVDDLKRIVVALPLHPYITGLCLSECALDDEHAEVLATTIGTDAMVCLELPENNITAKGVAALAFHPTVSRLDLRWNPFTFNEASSLFQGIRLTDLTFSNKETAGKSNAAKGYKILAENQTLTKLHVISANNKYDYERFSAENKQLSQNEYDAFLAENRERAQSFVDASGRDAGLPFIQRLLDTAQVSPYAQSIYPAFDAEKPCSALHVAVLTNQQQIARYLVKNFPALLRISAGNGESPQQIAVRLKNIEMLAFLRSPNDLLQQCHLLLKYKVPQLYRPDDPLAAFIVLEAYLNEQIESAISTAFNFNELSRFIDQQEKSPSANLLIAMILASPLGVFYDPEHPAHKGTVSEIEYRANRLIDATRYAFKAMSTSDIRMIHLTLVFLLNLKGELKNCLESDTALDDLVIERINETLRSLENTTFYRSKSDKRAVPLPPIDLVIRQPRLPRFFALPIAVMETEAKHAGVRFLM